MLNDSVREELALKISPLARAVRTQAIKAEAKDKPVAKPVIPLPSPPIISVEPTPVSTPVALPPVVSPAATVEQPEAAASVSIEPAPEKTPAPPAPPLRTITTELTSKPTSPTLVEFHNKNATLPDWRLQLQNSVRMRAERGTREQTAAPQTAVRQNAARPQRTALATKGATALQPEYVEKPLEKEKSVHAGNPKLAAALERIEASRRQYLAEESQPAAETPQPKAFPYIVTSKAADFPVKKAEPEPISHFAEPASHFSVKPKFVVSESAPKAEKFDTNKLPPLTPQTKIEPKIEPKTVEREVSPEIKRVASSPVASEKKTFLNCEVIEEIDLYETVEGVTDEPEADDRAPVSLRFNAGLFDLIIGAFSSALLLSPFMLAGGKMFTFEGALAFLATLAVVMFIYLTASIGLMGRTFGMRLFSLEVVDIEENAYPSLHQAAVSSSVYLLSLAFGGIGFLTLFLNDEKRAAHDLLSGTIVVKEY